MSATNNIEYSKIGERVRKKREKLGMTKTGLAKKAECTRQWIADIENGKSTPNLEQAIRLCNALDCEMDYLCGTQLDSRKIYKEIGDYLGISEKAARALSLLKNNDTVSTLIESLITREIPNPETGEKIPYPSKILGSLYELCNSDYGEKSDLYYLVKPYEVEENRILTDTETGEIICNQDGIAEYEIAEYEKVKTGEIKYNLTADKCINAKKRFRLAELQLYDDLRRFIRKQRKKNNLTTYYD